jgi:hypothetical protein
MRRVPLFLAVMLTSLCRCASAEQNPQSGKKLAAGSKVAIKPAPPHASGTGS